MIVVTGGAGFIGSAIVWALNKRGIDDILVVDDLGNSAKWKNLSGLSFSDYVEKGVFRRRVLESDLPDSISAVIHMGACSSTTETNASFLIENNYEYSKDLAEYAIDNTIRFVYASSAATYGDGSLGYEDDHDLISRLRPLNMYGYSKQLFDLWAIRNELLDRIAGLKFSNVYGPNEYHKEDMRSVVHKAYYQIRDSGSIRLFKSYKPDYGDGEQKRDFIYVKDAVEMVLFFLDHPDVNGIYNVGFGIARTWNDVANACFAALDQLPKIEYIDMPESLRPKYQYFTELNMDKLSEAGFEKELTTLEDGIANYYQNYLMHDAHLE